MMMLVIVLLRRGVETMEGGETETQVNRIN